MTTDTKICRIDDRVAEDMRDLLNLSRLSRFPQNSMKDVVEMAAAWWADTEGRNYDSSKDQEGPA